jgi:hypothetical protein
MEWIGGRGRCLWGGYVHEEVCVAHLGEGELKLDGLGDGETFVLLRVTLRFFPQHKSRVPILTALSSHRCAVTSWHVQLPIHTATYLNTPFSLFAYNIARAFGPVVRRSHSAWQAACHRQEPSA